MTFVNNDDKEPCTIDLDKLKEVLYKLKDNNDTTEIYKDNGYDIALVQQLLQHSSIAITQRYIGISSQMQEKALQNHIRLL